MKRALLVILLLAYPSIAAAEYYKVYYKVTVTRAAQDLYKTSEGVYIKTRWCYEYAYMEDAILKWDGPYSYGGELIFMSGGSKCDVEKVLQ